MGDSGEGLIDAEGRIQERMEELERERTRLQHGKVVRDPEARYFGGRVEQHSLVPLGDARLGRIGLDEWIRRSRAKA